MLELPKARISEATNRLERFGWIEKIGNGGRSKACKYKLKKGTESVTVYDNEKGTKTVSDSPDKGYENCNPLSAKGYENCIQKGTKTVTRKESSSEVINTTPPNPPTKIPDWLDSDTWNGFISYRKEIKKPMTEKAQSLAIGKLEKWRLTGSDPTEIINQSIMNGWTGLFELKVNGNATHQQTHKPRTVTEHAHAIAEASKRDLAESLAQEQLD